MRTDLSIRLDVREISRRPADPAAAPAHRSDRFVTSANRDHSGSSKAPVSTGNGPPLTPARPDEREDPRLPKRSRSECLLSGSM